MKAKITKARKIELETIGTALGVESFAAGLPVAPYCNKKVMDLVAEFPSFNGESVMLMTAYVNAWTRENLRAMVA